MPKQSFRPQTLKAVPVTGEVDLACKLIKPFRGGVRVAAAKLKV